jgi:hypothetical protein
MTPVVEEWPPRRSLAVAVSFRFRQHCPEAHVQQVARDAP